jgi:TRAP transporter 4TM/12TM fusion protein
MGGPSRQPISSERNLIPMKTRTLEGGNKILLRIVAVAFSGVFLLNAGIRIMPMEVTRSVYLMCNVLMALLLYPAARGKGGDVRIPWYDYILMVLCVVTFSYWAVTYREYAIVLKGQSQPRDFYFGIIAVLLLFEIARRVIGWIIPVVGAIFLVQLYFGPYLPGTFAHKGFSLFRIVDFMYRTDQAIFGTITNTFCTYVLPFVIMGAFMDVSGAGNFFIRMALSMTKGWAGGPAKVAVIASAIFGSISGSSSANVVSTGTFTIPMMKKVGFRPEHAGAIEAAASTGGQMLPPVMGAGAFLLATLTETPYIRIAVMNIIPALLYYYWCLAAVHCYAKRNSIGNLPDNEIPDLRETLKEGWFFIVPIVAVFAMMLMGYAPDRAAFAAIVCCVVLSRFTKENRMGVKDFLRGLELGSRNNVSVGSAIGILGVVMGGVVLGGLAQKFGLLVVSLSGGNIFFAICLVGLVGIIIGMGATQTATYILMSLIVVPGLITLGVNSVLANVIAFWFSALSNVTPPVCVSAFAGASIAGADPMKTGFVGMVYSFMLFVLPFTFYYFPEILLNNGFTTKTVYSVVCLMTAIPMVASGIMGYLSGPLNTVLRITLFVGGLLVFIPEGVTDVTGVILLAVVLFIQKKRGSRPGATV